MPRQHQRRRVGLAAVAGLALLLAGCTAATPGAGDPARLPASVKVSVFQNRSDIGPRHLEVEVANGSKRDITVHSGSYSSAWVTGSAPIDSLPYTIPAGSTVDFPLALPKPACGAARARPRVKLAFSIGSSSGTAAVAPKELFDALAQVNRSDCQRASFEEIVTITPAKKIRIVRSATTRPVAELPITFTPTGKPGTVTVVSIQDTTLLNLTLAAKLPLHLSAATGARTVILRATPGRCETHVLSEDKIGTVLPFHAVTPEFATAAFRFDLSDQLRKQLYEYFPISCDWKKFASRDGLPGG
jgi:hypothetical protein